jgi:hypothetical protein
MTSPISRMLPGSLVERHQAHQRPGRDCTGGAGATLPGDVAGDPDGHESLHEFRGKWSDRLHVIGASQQFELRLVETPCLNRGADLLPNPSIAAGVNITSARAPPPTGMNPWVTPRGIDTNEP